MLPESLMPSLAQRQNIRGLPELRLVPETTSLVLVDSWLVVVVGGTVHIVNDDHPIHPETGHRVHCQAEPTACNHARP